MLDNNPIPIVTAPLLESLVLGKTIEEAEAAVPGFTFLPLVINGREFSPPIPFNYRRYNVALKDGLIIKLISLG